MSMKVLSLMGLTGGEIYYTNTWRLLVETHMTWLRARNESQMVAVTPQIAYKYEGDLYGALTELNIPRYMHWTIMRINGLLSPADFKGEAVMLMVPLQETFNSLAAVAATTQKKIT
ncbi:baseplate wedge protein [Xanthomonas phage RTH11]|nr:baseplate wedge protein [Xanthomonas phage RTH11]